MRRRPGGGRRGGRAVTPDPVPTVDYGRDQEVHVVRHVRAVPGPGHRPDDDARVHERHGGAEGDHEGDDGDERVGPDGDLLGRVDRVTPAEAVEPVDGDDRDEGRDPVADEQQHVLEPGRRVPAVYPQDEEERDDGDDQRGHRAAHPDAHGLQRERAAVVVHRVRADGRQGDDDERQPAEEPAAHHAADTLGGLGAERPGPGDADGLDTDVAEHDAAEAVPEDRLARRGRGQVAAVVRGVAGPRDGQAQRDRDLEDERAGQVAVVDGGRRHDLVPAEQLDGQHGERDDEHDGHHGLDPVDELVAEDAHDSLQRQDDQHPHPERGVQQGRQRLAAEQADQPVPGDRGDPLDDGREDHRPAERHPRGG